MTRQNLSLQDVCNCSFIEEYSMVLCTKNFDLKFTFDNELQFALKEHKIFFTLVVKIQKNKHLKMILNKRIINNKSSFFWSFLISFLDDLFLEKTNEKINKLKYGNN
ncbi:hypothetical protein BpHYR1_012310 [Brachionus plicatilis]|uniref:Uncharacterized protein n=1 Tax=Brachionus plicatilis TaxID=10195 RepID=A0A3M7R7J1_BRAPC|nr:hypothetical protein BpHYR1_012310 [Brachionus plicatilis]